MERYYSGWRSFVVLRGARIVRLELPQTLFISSREYRRLACNIYHFNPLRPSQNGRHFADDTLSRIFLNENARISIKISLKFAPKGPINSIPSLVQIMAWRRPGDKPLSEPMMVSLLSHICVIRPQCVKPAYVVMPKILGMEALKNSLQCNSEMPLPLNLGCVKKRQICMLFLIMWGLVLDLSWINNFVHYRVW